MSETREAAPATSAEIVPEIRTSVVALVVLLTLTAVTVAVAMLELPASVHAGAAMGIAAVKAVLVAFYFMHLGHEGRVVHVLALSGLVLLATMIVFILIDVFTRGPVG
ncbi:MAG TPA: cytochrome C oxidase subunit IV family protein [Nannocystis sp.]